MAMPQTRNPITRPAGALLLASLAFCVGACAVASTGELSAAACSDPGNVDDDGDGLANCDDPDCWVYSFCGLPLQAIADGGGPSSADGSARFKDAGFKDAGSTGMTGDDGGPASSLDASATPPTCDGAVCPTSYLPGEFQIAITAGSIPAYKGVATLCLDTSCLVFVPAGACVCFVDTYVVVTVTTGSAVTTWMTTVVENKATPTWTDPGFQVHLEASSVIEFEVFDSDKNEGATNADDFIFRCKPDLANLSAGVLSCGPADNGDFINPQNYNVNASVTKLLSPN